MFKLEPNCYLFDNETGDRWITGFTLPGIGFILKYAVLIITHQTNGEGNNVRSLSLVSCLSIMAKSKAISVQEKLEDVRLLEQGEKHYNMFTVHTYLDSTVTNLGCSKPNPSVLLQFIISELHCNK